LVAERTAHAASWISIFGPPTEAGVVVPPVILRNPKRFRALKNDGVSLGKGYGFGGPELGHRE
jgi:hypothetical protein